MRYDVPTIYQELHRLPMKFIHLATAAILVSFLSSCQVVLPPLGPDDNAIVDETGNGDTGPGGGPDNGGGNSGEIKTSVTLYWSTPFKRVNGEPLSTDDISGYEIRYRKTSDTEFQHVFIDNAATEQYQFTGLDNALMYQFELAVVDKNGIYSEFITAVE